MKTEERKARICREQDFYAKCGEMLQLNMNAEYQEPQRRTRWRRSLSNGRFHGFGIIQMFGPSYFRVISKVHGTKIYKSEQEVYDFLLTL